MGQVKITCFSISADGFGAGPDQNFEHPVGHRGKELHQWMFRTEMMNSESGLRGVDNEFIKKSFENVGAWIMGRHMFGPMRGEWTEDDWKGWWGEEPPFHTPVFVLSHFPRAPIEMQGGTIFYFITEGIEFALEEAKKVANGKDIRIGGGVATIRQYLQAGYIDEMHLAVVPIFLGKGESLFAGIDMDALGYKISKQVVGEGAVHLIVKEGE